MYVERQTHGSDQRLEGKKRQKENDQSTHVAVAFQPLGKLQDTGRFDARQHGRTADIRLAVRGECSCTTEQRPQDRPGRNLRHGLSESQCAEPGVNFLPRTSLRHFSTIKSVKASLQLLQLLFRHGDLIGMVAGAVPEFFGQENALSRGELRNVDVRFHRSSIAQKPGASQPSIPPPRETTPGACGSRGIPR